ncbi:putative ABC transporter ATP-binding protein YknV [Neptunitalea chrysea]|uniref:ABC transporter ATP-binding protein YknV n=1 Tax=Neptunitalea chrysea TaxID=1647581 RepID=A0A9W6B2E6_9FLAO|nr:ABC transporter ATP-binding protein [Neptunitalea chrysea]GLB51063.1 putative ABC transporter ATP-binding protein YknV [Neptunitalea chrysea]
MNYNLDQLFEQQKKTSNVRALNKLFKLIPHEKKNLWWAFFIIIINAASKLIAPLLVGYAVDNAVTTGDYKSLLYYAAAVLATYLVASGTQYFQTKVMGSIGQRMLYTLRNALFNKLQELPIGFFNQNKTGDIISRVNNDTDKINQFFSQSLMQFIGNMAIMIGAGVCLLVIHIQLGAATLIPGVCIFAFTLIVSPWIKKRNAISLKTTGNLSAEVQESLSNFKVVIAFNRRDYFRSRFSKVNNENYDASIKAGLANNLFVPVYGLGANFAQLIVLVYGISLIIAGNFTVGLLVSYIAYAQSFYNPLQQIAALWTNFQLAMAGWDRISQILNLESDLAIVEITNTPQHKNAVLSFEKVHFSYPEGKEVLHDINFNLEKGKTYALVGPTGGGKTTTASLIARLFDPTSGTIYLNGKNLKSYTTKERTHKIGFILQEPFLFSGTVKDNILYGNSSYENTSDEELIKLLHNSGLEELLSLFNKGLQTEVEDDSSISLGQKQVIAFMRAVLRNPNLLILDEATANIDTVTEQLLDKILKKLPKETTLIIIAHRLNTIESADEIFFINNKQVEPAGSLEEAVTKLMQDKRNS